MSLLQLKGNCHRGCVNKDLSSVHLCQQCRAFCNSVEITMALTHLQCMLDIALSLCAACVSAHKGKGTLRGLCRKLCLQCSNCHAAQVHKLHQLHTPTNRHQLAVFMLTAQSCAQIQAVVASLAGGGLQLLGAESAEQVQIAL